MNTNQVLDLFDVTDTDTPSAATKSDGPVSQSELLKGYVARAACRLGWRANLSWGFLGWKIFRRKTSTKASHWTRLCRQCEIYVG
jgi:hypothetical protein